MGEEQQVMAYEHVLPRRISYSLNCVDGSDSSAFAQSARDQK